MRTSGDCVWEKQHIWNIPDGLKKVIAGVVTVSLLVGIGDAVSMVPLQEDMRSYAATAGGNDTMECSDPVGTDGKTGEYPDLYTGRNGETCADRNGESS